MPLAEDEEAFKGAAPLRFGDSFARKMKKNLESLRRSMAPRSGPEQFFSEAIGRSHYPACAEIQPVPPKRKRETLPEEGQCSQKATTVIDFVNVCMCMSLPLVHVMPEMQIFYPSTIVNQLNCMGIEPRAT